MQMQQREVEGWESFYSDIKEAWKGGNNDKRTNKGTHSKNPTVLWNPITPDSTCQYFSHNTLLKRKKKKKDTTVLVHGRQFVQPVWNSHKEEI